MNYQKAIRIDPVTKAGTGSGIYPGRTGVDHSSGKSSLKTAELTYDKPFFEVFILCIILTFSPSKAIGMMIPVIAMIWYLIRSGSGEVFKRFILVVCAWAILVLGYNLHASLINIDFVTSNALLSFFHYSSFLLFFIFPQNVSSEKYNYEHFSKLILNILLFEGLFGIMQKILAPFLVGNISGDVVEGTINPLSFVSGHSGFSNQFYAINMGFFMIFSLPYIYKNKGKRIHFCIALIGVILASVGHVFFSMVLAVIISYCVFKSRSFLKIFGVVVVVAGVVFAVVDAATFDKPRRQAQMFFDGETPKSQAIGVAIGQVGSKYPTMHLVGLGPGQYSSRAGVIASGTYGPLSDLFRSIPVLDFRSAPLFRTYVQEVWEAVERNGDRYGNSTMYRPFFSLLSLYTEFGGIIFLLILAFLIYQIAALKRYYRMLGKDPKNLTARQLTIVTSVCLLFLFFIGMYENYFETPQGVFLGLLLIILSKSIIKEQMLTINTDAPLAKKWKG